MRHEITDYDRLRDLAHELDATIIAGAVAPPMNGQMWVADRTLEELLLPDGEACIVTLLIAAGGAPQHHIDVGRGALDEAGRQRMSELAAAIGASLHQGRLALLTPADWLALHPSPDQRPDSGAVPGAVEGGHLNTEGAQVEGSRNDALLEQAQAHGWPANLSNGPTLFLDERPLYHIMAQENVGRNVVLVVARHADTR
jgi:hypothetical protein